MEDLQPRSWGGVPPVRREPGRGIPVETLRINKEGWGRQQGNTLWNFRELYSEYYAGLVDDTGGHLRRSDKPAAKAFGRLHGVACVRLGGVLGEDGP
jgi:hypothetical protein